MVVVGAEVVLLVIFVRIWLVLSEDSSFKHLVIIGACLALRVLEDGCGWCSDGGIGGYSQNLVDDLIIIWLIFNDNLVIIVRI